MASLFKPFQCFSIVFRNESWYPSNGSTIPLSHSTLPSYIQDMSDSSQAKLLFLKHMSPPCSSVPLPLLFPLSRTPFSLMSIGVVSIRSKPSLAALSKLTTFSNVPSTLCDEFFFLSVYYHLIYSVYYLSCLLFFSSHQNMRQNWEENFYFLVAAVSTVSSRVCCEYLWDECWRILATWESPSLIMQKMILPSPSLGMYSQTSFVKFISI